MSFSFNAFDGFLGGSPTELRFEAADAPFGSNVEIRIVGSGLSFDSGTGVLLGTVSELRLFDVTSGNVLTTLDVDDTLTSSIAADVTEFLQDSLRFIADVEGFGVPFDFPDNAVFSPDGTTLTVDMIVDGDPPTVVGQLRFTGTGLGDLLPEFGGTITMMELLSADGSTVLDTVDYSSDPLSFAEVGYAVGSGELLYQVFAKGDDVVSRGAFELAEDPTFGDLLVGGGGDNVIAGSPSFPGFADYIGSLGPVTVNLAAGTATHSDGTDTLGNIDAAAGSLFSDVLIGSSGKNALFGLAGNDKLTGGLGQDFLFGMEGADRFDFNSVKDSKKGNKLDIIVDFEKSVAGEKIDLKDIDAIKGGPKNDKFKFIGTKDFSGKAGELHTIKKGGILIVEGDINGDGKADFQIGLEGVSSLKADDFIL